MPAYILNQPDDFQLATRLNEILGKPEVLRFDALVAFALSSGVQQLELALESLMARGGKIRIVVGVSRRVTSVEGLELLLRLAEKGAEVFVFHNDNPDGPIFHPKLYLLREPQNAVLIVGSNNLTGKGLIGNYEISLQMNLDPSDATDEAFLKSIDGTIGQYCDVSSGLSHVLSKSFLKELEREGYIGSEARGTNKPETSAESDSATAVVVPRRKLFGSKAVPRTPTRRSAPARTTAPASSPSPPSTRGKLVGEKTLQISDTPAVRPGSNPTGGVRLTQAAFHVGGKIINQTKYFREQVFRNENWRPVTRRGPFREQASVRFYVEIAGQSLGVHTLKVSHKPSGEAGQGNYTDQIHWGDLTNSIPHANLARRQLRLFAPAPGTVEPFFIEIN